MKKIILTIIVVASPLLAGCKTDFDSFEKAVSVGVTYDQVKRFLEEKEIAYNINLLKMYLPG